MQQSLQSKLLNLQKLGWFRQLFPSLEIPTMAQLNGRFSAEIIGPWWMRALAGPSLAWGGLGGWCGKRFDHQGHGVNLVMRERQIKEVLPIQLLERPSLVDSKPGLTVVYPATSPFPWPYIVDELRWLDSDTLLGLTIITERDLQKLAFPFLLRPAVTTTPEIPTG